MGNYYKCGTNNTGFAGCKSAGYSSSIGCSKNNCQKSYGCHKLCASPKSCGCDSCEECKCLEAEMKEMLECLMRLEELSDKKIDKAREYQEQVEILLAKAMEAQCKASELLAEADCIEEEAAELREKTYQIIFKTVECYRNECCNKCCCKCNCCNKN